MILFVLFVNRSFNLLQSIAVAYKAMFKSGMAIVQGYQPRPSIRVCEALTGPVRTYTFMEAVSVLDIWGKLMMVDDSFKYVFSIEF